MRQLNYIDLFSGCGGLSLGFYNAKIKGVFSVEKNPDAFRTLKYNLIDTKSHFLWPEWLPIDVHDIDELIGKYDTELKGLENTIDIVAGGPPCQGFSMAGMRDSSDARNKLVYSYLKFVKIIKPKYIFFENVIGITMPFKDVPAFSNDLINQFSKLGYQCEGRIVNFSEFGVPQNRKRFILFGTLLDNPNIFFDFLNESRDKFLEENSLSSCVCISEAISDLELKNGVYNSKENPRFQFGKYGQVQSPYQYYIRENMISEYPDSHRFANHSLKTIEKFELLHKHNSDKNLSELLFSSLAIKKRSIRVLNKSSFCPTLTSNPEDLIHYSERRILTVREYARLQGFPDYYFFKGKYTTGGLRRRTDVPRYTQIANAISPIFSEIVGKAITRYHLLEHVPMIKK